MLPLIAAFGLVNAILYCLLLPLWEGFDEPFHYGYAQALAVRRQLPVLGRTPMSEEILRSLRVAPASHVVRRNLPFVTTFAEFAALPEAERRRRRESLQSLPVSLREVDDPGSSNYEAQQAPLAYLPLAAVDHLWRKQPLVTRVLMARLVGALAATLAQFWLTLALARELGLGPPMRALALFLIFCCQMFYAATAHVANDWLSIPLTTLVVVAVLRFHRSPGLATGAWLGSAVAAGLLAKAYFLPWALFAAVLAGGLAWRRRARAPAGAAVLLAAGLAGPWYVRNLLLYHSLSGMLQAGSGSGPVHVFRVALELPWPRVLLALARRAVWTGNNSFTSFSSATVDTLLCLLAAAAVMWAWRSRKPSEWMVAAGCLCFFAGLLYAAVVFAAYTGGGLYSATPWYPQALAAPLACLFCLGLGRAGLMGRLAACGLAVVSAYLIAATYVAKLIPMYSGFNQGRMTAARLFQWYAADRSHWMAVLADTALGEAGLVLVLTAAVVLMSAGISAALCRSILSAKGSLQ
jgi:hypothetical protein